MVYAKNFQCCKFIKQILLLSDQYRVSVSHVAGVLCSNHVDHLLHQYSFLAFKVRHTDNLDTDLLSIILGKL